MDHAEKIEIVNRYVNAFNAKDLDSILALYASGATMEDPVGSAPATSPDEMGALYRMGFEMDLRMVLEGPVRTVEGAVAFPLRATMPDGHLDIIDVFEFNEAGQIVHMKAYWSDDTL